MITGRLDERPLPVVLEQLYTERFTGELVINTRAGLVQVYLREGYPVYVNLSEGADLLGKILFDMRILDETSYRRSLSVPPEPGKRYGDVVMRLGLCDEAALKQALRAQVRRKLHRLFALTEGGYAAVPGEHGRGMQGGESLRVHPRRMIYLGVRSFAPERLRGLLRPLESEQAVRLRESEEGGIARFGFGPQETYVVDILRRGYWTLHELIEVAGLQPPLILAVTYSLWVGGQLDAALADSVPRARDHITDLPTPPPAGITSDAAVLELPARPMGRPSSASAQPPSAGAPAPAAATAPQKAVRTEPAHRTEPAARPEPTDKPRKVVGESIIGLELEKSPSAATAPAKESERESKPRLNREPAPAGDASPPKEAHPPAAADDPKRSGGQPTPQSRPSIPAARPGTPSGLRMPPGASQSRVPVQGAKPQQGGRPVSFEEMALLRADIENKAKVIDDETLFAVLGVAETGDVAAVKAAFLTAAKKYHPDRIVAMGMQGLKEQADKIFRRVNEAHSVLSDPERREDYLAELKLKESSGDKGQKEKELAVKAVNAELAFSRGTVFLRKRDFNSAAREFEEAVRLNPDEGEHVGYYTWSAFCAEKLSAADSTRDLLKATRMSPKCGRLYYFLGVLYKQAQSDDKALQAFKKAMELDPRIEEASSEIRLMETRRARGGKPGSGDSRGKSSESKGGEKKKLSFLDKLRQPLSKK